MRLKNYMLSIFVVLPILITSCGLSDDFEEIVRLSSPDNLVDAILYRAGGGGATSGFTYSLFVVKKGMKPDKSNNILFQADHLTNANLVWLPDRILEIRYNEARVFQFKNFWHSRDIQNFQYVIEIKLAPTHDGHALSRKVRFLEGFDMSGRIISPDSSNDSACHNKLNPKIR